MSEALSGEPTCKGKTSVSEHRMVEVGECQHGRPEWLVASVCRDCGATAHRSKGFVCARTRRAPKPVERTTETCAALRAKAEAEGRTS
jgi:hypothetical protein